MKLNKIYTWASAILLSLASSCRDDTFDAFRDDGNEMRTVTFTVDLEGMGSITRSVNDETTFDKIGGGSQINVLKYAVYYNSGSEDDPVWEADESYETKKNPFKEGEKEASDEIKKTGYGQTILEVDNFPVTINLALKKSESYKIVFWAQNSSTDAFVTEDLRKVQMKYKLMGKDNGKGDVEALSINNDETRDAFCRSISVEKGQPLTNTTVFLKRPLAQINVGTRGFDYETITRNAPKKYLYSKIRINRAARYLDVVEDKVYTNTTHDDSFSIDETEAFYTIDYEYNLFPAYWKTKGIIEEINEQAKQSDDYGFRPSYTIYDFYDKELNSEGKPVNNPQAYVPKELKDNGAYSDWFDKIYSKEEFLKVRLYKKDRGNPDIYEKDDIFDPEYLSYVPLADGNEHNDKMGEVFKYLSMCYILTNCDPVKHDHDENDESEDEYGGDVLTNVKMWIATDKDGSDEVEVLNLNNVPVQRNRRTNIVGSLLTANANVTITLDDDFAGQKLSNTESLSGEIAEGLYYDATANDGNGELQISSLNGLLVFQQLVNGDLVVRTVGQNTNYLGKGMVGGPYPYMVFGELEPRELQAKSFGKPADEHIQNLILEASHYHRHEKDGFKDIIEESEGDWPIYNQFSFAGATVKLMADIDLDGINWIPIGWDICNWDNSISLAGQPYYEFNYRSITKIDKNNSSFEEGKTKIDVSNRRVFCGTFDGNGHTIYNMTTYKFSQVVHESQKQQIDMNDQGEVTDYRNFGPYDNVQWMPQGFFGLVGPKATIKDLRLQEVDVLGHNGVAGLVGEVSSIGFPVLIDNCVVDGGVIEATPLYRGDFRDDYYYGRSYARGVYVGGIVGQFVACGNETDLTSENPSWGVNNCEVRNVTVHGYRRIGGIIGSISDQETENFGVPYKGSSILKPRGNQAICIDIPFYNNKISNSTVLADQFQAFGGGLANQWGEEKASDVWQNGFGWSSPLQSLGDRLVGGIPPDPKENVIYSQEDYNSKGHTNVNYSEYKIVARDKDTGEEITKEYLGSYRRSDIENVPLNIIPMLSSWFTDSVYLHNNYYGDSGIHTRVKYEKLPIYSPDFSNVSDLEYSLPFNLPYSSKVNYIEKDSPKAAMYVENIRLDGREAPGNRSVITANGITDEGACVMYVTARDRKQFANHIWNKRDVGGKFDDYDNNKYLNNIAKYTYETIIKDVVLRGSPYAWAAILMAPNENMKKLTLFNVTIYDTYKTITKDFNGLVDKDKKGLHIGTWNSDKMNDDDGKDTPLEATKCNFRGFTQPGENWQSITYNSTTFEQGAETYYSNTAKYAPWETIKKK